MALKDRSSIDHDTIKLWIVRDVSFYHGGDVLYSLEKIPGTWHEQCLSSDDTRNPIPGTANTPTDRHD